MKTRFLALARRLFFAVLRIRHRVAVFFDRQERAWLRSRGYAKCSIETLLETEAVLERCLTLVIRSGHLNTVSDRKPRSVHRLEQMALYAIINIDGELRRNRVTEPSTRVSHHA